MSEQDAYCFYCEVLRADDADEIHALVREFMVEHGGEAVYVVTVKVGGDIDKCKKFSAMVRSYLAEEMKGANVVDMLPRNSGKPN
jgi:hypothetical protein